MTAGAGKGLAGVVVAETRKSEVDGENGRLYYGGYRIQDLAAKATFEEVVYLLWNDKLPNKQQLDEFTKAIAAEMTVPQEVIETMHRIPKKTHPMLVLETTVSMLAGFDPDVDDNSPEANRRKALRLIGKTTTLTSAWGRIREGKEVIAPRPDLTLAGNFLYMFTGNEPDADATKAIDMYFTLLADHGLNASTFTARVVTSTDSDIHSAITGAIASLKGAKHGGANEAAMKMFLEIGSLENVEPWFTNEVKGKDRKIMGIGHRVYKAHDPRAGVLREHAERLAQSSGNAKWFDIAAKLEELARADDYFIERKLYANVDYYSAIVLYTLDIPIDFFTPLFAISRVAGWSAHIFEQWADNRLIRPDATYLGELDLEFVPLEQR